jgi:hypothetical protein
VVCCNRVTCKAKIVGADYALFMTAEVLVIVLPFAVILERRYRARQTERRAAQKDKRQAADAFWERRSQGNRR